MPYDNAIFLFLALLIFSYLWSFVMKKSQKLQMTGQLKREQAQQFGRDVVSEVPKPSGVGLPVAH